MENLADFEDFLKRQIHYHDKAAWKNKDNPSQVSFHSEYRDTFQKLLDACKAASTRLLEQEKKLVSLLDESAELKALKLSTPIVSRGDPYELTQDDLRGLPKELLEQLNIPVADQSEKLIIDLIAGAGGVLSFSKLMIGIYRISGEIPQKRTLQGKVYRMIDKKLIFKVPGKKGLFTTEQMPDSGETDAEGDDQDL